jgi:hypothetical protein
MNASFSAGHTIQDFWQGSERSQYARNVEAINGSVVRDSNGAVSMLEHKVQTRASADSRRSVYNLDADDIRSRLGRGPGRSGGLFV